MTINFLKVAIPISVFCFHCTNPHPVFSQFQSVEFSSSPNPVGSGARAIGMGGAFIGVADDATAASWNPGGLIQLETPELSVVGAYNYRKEDTTYMAFPEASGPQSFDSLEVNYFSLAYPFTMLKHNMVVSINYQQLYNFTKKVKYSFDSVAGPENIHYNLEFDQTGALRTITPALAVQITPKLSAGMALNFWTDAFYKNGWESTQKINGVGQIGINDIITQAVISEENDFNGFNYTLGFLWDLNTIFTFGGVFKAPFTADTTYESRVEYTITYPSVPAADQSGTNLDFEKQKLNMPMSYGIGCAMRLGDAITLALDVYRTDWSDYYIEKENGNKISPINNKPLNEADIKDTTQIRFGGEYLFIGNRWVVPIRAGLFYDPEPAEGSPDDFYGISIGGGLVFKKAAWDVAYMFRFGQDVNTVTVGQEISIQDVYQHTLYMSLIYYF